MRVKFVIGELKGLEKYKPNLRSRNGFQSFMVGIRWRVDKETGEIDLDDEDFAKIRLYSRTGYKKKLFAVFRRTLGDDFEGR